MWDTHSYRHVAATLKPRDLEGIGILLLWHVAPAACSLAVSMGWLFRELPVYTPDTLAKHSLPIIPKPNYDFSQPLARKKSWKWEYESVVDGHRVLPMSVADTDFVSPREVTATLRAIVDGGEFGYPSYPEDHQQVFANWQKQRHGWELDPDNVIIANGLLSSLHLMLENISSAGEGVIIFTPVY